MSESGAPQLSALEEAARDWSATFDAMNDMVCLLAADGTVLRCNRAMGQFLGLEQHEAIGRKCYQLMHNSRTFFPDCPLAEMTHTGRRECMELALGDGLFEVVADPLTDETGSIVGCVHIVRDVTERRRAQDALAEKSRWLSDILALAVDLASLPREEDVGAFLARRIRELTGSEAIAFSDYEPTERVLATRLIELRPGAKGRIAGPLLRRLEGTRSPVSDEMYGEILGSAVGKPATLTEASFGAIPPAADISVRRLLGVDRFVGLAFVAEGELYGTCLLALKAGAPEPPEEFLELLAHLAVVSLRRRRAEAQINALNASLERRVRERTRELAAANRDLQELVYSVAHDLRTPLRAVDGFSLMVLERYGHIIDEPGREDLQRVRTAAQTMGELIDALLSLTLVGRRKVAFEEVDLSMTARRAIAELRGADPDRVVEASVQDGLIVEADKTLLEVVLRNLIGNAWKFTAGRQPSRIEVGVVLGDAQAEFFVADNGVGFDPAYADKLFTPFQRLHSAKEFSGTGVGLAAVARALERLGGTWRAEGQPNGGATFFFTIGRDQTEAPGGA